MASKVEIANLALSHVRAQTITSMEEASQAARECSRFYHVCKDLVLSEAPWKFATRWDRLPQFVNTTEGWKYAYQLPSDFLRVWRIRTESPVSGQETPPSHVERTEYGELPFDLVPLEAESRYSLVSNSHPISAKITYRVDEGLFPNYIAMALSHLLAVYIAVPLSGVETGGVTRDKQHMMYKNTVAAANEGDSSHQNIVRPTPRYIDVRW